MNIYSRAEDTKTIIKLMPFCHYDHPRKSVFSQSTPMSELGFLILAVRATYIHTIRIEMPKENDSIFIASPI